jgi:hypothetical protein
LLRPVRVSVLCQVLARDLIGKSFVRFGEFDELRVGFFLSLILRELDFVRVAMRSQVSNKRGVDGVDGWRDISHNCNESFL